MPSDVDQDQPEVVDVDLGTLVERVDWWVDGFIKLLPNIGVAVVLIFLAWFIAKLLGRALSWVKCLGRLCGGAFLFSAFCWR